MACQRLTVAAFRSTTLAPAFCANASMSAPTARMVACWSFGNLSNTARDIISGSNMN
eukprot:gene41895-51925_t